MTGSVFISYASEDVAIAEMICARIEGRGIGCWIAPRDVSPGAHYGEEIVSAIEASRVVIVVVSSHANGSAHVMNEVVTAFNKGKRIIPVRVEEVEPAKQFQLFLVSAHWVEAWTEEREGKIDLMVRSLESHLLSEPGTPRHSDDRSSSSVTTSEEVAKGRGIAKRWLVAGVISTAIILCAAVVAWFALHRNRNLDGWYTISSGVQLRCFGMEEIGIAERDPFEVCSLRADRDNVRLKVAWRSDGVEYKFLLRDYGGLAAVNGGFYDEEYMPQGWLVIDGVEKRPPFEGYSGILFVDKNGAAHIDWARNMPTDTPRFALQSNPLLVEPDGVMGIRGGAASDFSARSCVCLDFRDRIHLISTRIEGDGFTGLSLYELADWLRKDESNGGLGARVCMNLDGGPLAALHIKSATGDFSLDISQPGIEGARKATSPTAIVVVPR